MLTPRLVVRDKRPLLEKIATQLNQNVSERGTVNIPEYQVCYQYISRRAKAIGSVVMFTAITLLSTIVYQTVYPSFNNTQPYSIQANLPSIHDPAPNYQPFDIQNNQPTISKTTYQTNVEPNQLKCLAKNIYFEARSESLKGQIAVGLVTLNRVLDQRFPDTICKVVWQERQFSWTHDGVTDQPNKDYVWEQSKEIAQFLISNGTVDHVHDFTDNAIYYHANYVSPYWNRKFMKTVEVGLHLFYRPASQ